jgi:hypothetical protein
VNSTARKATMQNMWNATGFEIKRSECEWKPIEHNNPKDFNDIIADGAKKEKSNKSDDETVN